MEFSKSAPFNVKKFYNYYIHNFMHASTEEKPVTEESSLIKVLLLVRIFVVFT